MKFKRRKYAKQTLKCYEKEIEKYKYLYRAYITAREANRVIELLNEHFRVGPKSINFDYGSESYGGVTTYAGAVSFRKEHLNLGIVCHELCHVFCHRKKIFGHGNKFYSNLDKFMEFVEGKLDFYIKIKGE